AFWWLLTPLAHFIDWAAWVENTVASILSYANIYSYFKIFLDKALEAWNWIRQAPTFIYNLISFWWSSTSLTVQGWIAIATQGFNNLVVAWDYFWTITWPQLTGNLATLRSEWDNFWRVSYPTLVSFTWLATWWTSTMVEV
ncbi:unnamed protein product, partial [marine sediment metagenome]